MGKNNQNDIIRIAAEAGAKAALETLEREKKKAQKSRYDRRLRNTRLLLRNYRMFRDHVENAVFEAEQLDENAIDILDLMSENIYDNDLYVESIKKSVARTKIIMEHVNEMLRIYEAYCFRSGETGRPAAVPYCRCHVYCGRASDDQRNRPKMRMSTTERYSAISTPRWRSFQP